MIGYVARQATLNPHTGNESKFECQRKAKIEAEVRSCRSNKLWMRQNRS